MSTRKTRCSAKTEELTQQIIEQIEANIWDEGKPEVYLQFALLEQFPQLMEPGNLRPKTMRWKSTPGLFKRIPTLPTLTVKPTIWDKWCDGNCAFWEPTQLAKDFHPRVALIVCYSHYQDLLQDSLQEKKTISLSVVYVPEHWILPSFSEAAYMVNHAWDAKDPLGMMSLAWIHKKSLFYPDISYQEYKQHLTVIPLLPSWDGLGLCGYTKNFAIGALHWRQDIFCKGREITSWAPPAFWKAAPGELVLISGSGSKTWGYTGLVPERHNVPMAPLDSFVQLSRDEAGEAILPDYAFALCIPSSWPFPSLMDKTILPESYFSEGNPVEEDTNTTTVTKKTRKHRGKKTQNRSKMLEPPAVPRKPAQVRTRPLPRLKKNMSSKSSRIYISLPTALTQRFWNIPITLQRVETWEIPGRTHRVHLWPLIKSPVAYPVFRVTTNCRVMVRTIWFNSSRMPIPQICTPLPQTLFLS